MECVKENESRTPSRFLACVTERMKLALTEMEETTGQGEKITRCLVLNVLIFFCLLDIEVEKLGSLPYITRYSVMKRLGLES